MASDPARAVKRTKEETVKLMQEACRKVPCSVVAGGRIGCPFCPHYRRKDEKT